MIYIYRYIYAHTHTGHIRGHHRHTGALQPAQASRVLHQEPPTIRPELLRRAPGRLRRAIHGLLHLRRQRCRPTPSLRRGRRSGASLAHACVMLLRLWCSGAREGAGGHVAAKRCVSSVEPVGYMSLSSHVKMKSCDSLRYQDLQRSLCAPTRSSSEKGLVQNQFQ